LLYRFGFADEVMQVNVIFTKGNLVAVLQDLLFDPDFVDERAMHTSEILQHIPILHGFSVALAVEILVQFQILLVDFACSEDEMRVQSSAGKPA